MNKNFLEFEKARFYVRSLGLKNQQEWIEYSKTKRPNFIPSNPDHTYKDRWVSLMDWLGYDLITKHYYLNEDYFKKWTSNMAYVLGLWFSDGHITGQSVGRFIFGIAQDESEILELISKDMKSDYPIRGEKERKNGKISYRLRVESETIVNDIMRLGGDYRKSLTCEFPPLPQEYLRDFIRGLWDGDGSAFWTKDGKYLRCKSSYTSGSKCFIEELLRILQVNVPEIGGCIAKYKNKNAYNLNLSANGSRRLRDFMYYEGCLCLKRKREKFFSFGDTTIREKRLVTP